MIYVTTGTHPQPFDRLITAMDTFAGTTDEEVVIQYGSSRLKLQKATGFAFNSWDEARRYMQRARVIVAHAGTGTLVDAISLNKPIIVWARLSLYNEHVNNHQVEIAETMSQQGRAIMVSNYDELFAALCNSHLPFPQLKDGIGGGLVRAIRETLSVIRNP